MYDVDQPALSAPLPENAVEFRPRRSDPAGALWLFQIVYVPLPSSAAQRRKQPWPRLKLKGKWRGSVVRVRARGDDREDNPIIEWTFSPNAAGVYTKRELDPRGLSWDWGRIDLDPSRVKHILDLVPEIKWSAGGRHPISRKGGRSVEMRLARRGRTLRERNWAWGDIVDKLRMVPYDNNDDVIDDPIVVKKARDAAIKRLQRYIRALEKAEQDA